MDREELISFLKENLKIEHTQYGDTDVIDVRITLSGELISETRIFKF